MAGAAPGPSTNDPATIPEGEGNNDGNANQNDSGNNDGTDSQSDQTSTDQGGNTTNEDNSNPNNNSEQGNNGGSSTSDDSNANRDTSDSGDMVSSEVCGAAFPGCAQCSLGGAFFTEPICIRCEDGLALEDGHCHGCVVEGCNTCIENDPHRCETCESNYVLVSSSCETCDIASHPSSPPCIGSCPDSQYRTGDGCITGLANCESALLSAALQTGIEVFNDVGASQGRLGCTTCETGHWRSSSTGLCESCSSAIAYCSTCVANIMRGTLRCT